MSQIQQEINELEQELSDLNSFEGTTRQDCSDVESQLSNKKRIIQQIGNLGDLAMLQQFASSMEQSQFGDALTLYNRGLSGVTDEITSTRNDLQRRIDELRRQLASLQTQISNQQTYAAQCDRNVQSATTSLQAAQRERT